MIVRLEGDSDGSLRYNKKFQNTYNQRRRYIMKNKLIITCICVVMIVSSLFTTSVSAAVWSNYNMPVGDGTTNKWYYEVGVGTDTVRSETGVNVSNTYNVYALIQACNNAGTQVVNVDKTSTTTRYAEASKTVSGANYYSNLKSFRTSNKISPKGSNNLPYGWVIVEGENSNVGGTGSWTITIS